MGVLLRACLPLYPYYLCHISFSIWIQACCWLYHLCRCLFDAVFWTLYSFLLHSIGQQHNQVLLLPRQDHIQLQQYSYLQHLKQMSFLFQRVWTSLLTTFRTKTEATRKTCTPCKFLITSTTSKHHCLSIP